MLGIYHEAQKKSLRVIYGVDKEYGEEYRKENWGTLFRQWRRVHKWSFFTVIRDEGIERHFIIRETPQQNKVAERMNMTLLEKVLIQCQYIKSFWAETLVYVFHLVNRLPSSVIEGKTLLKVWSGIVAQVYDSLRVFGCLAYYHVKEDKLGPRARKGVFIEFKKV